MKVLHLETGRHKTAIRSDGLVFMGYPPAGEPFVDFAEASGAIVFRCGETAYVDVGWLSRRHADDPAALKGLEAVVRVAHETARRDRPGFLQLH